MFLANFLIFDRANNYQGWTFEIEKGYDARPIDISAIIVQTTL